MLQVYDMNNINMPVRKISNSELNGLFSERLATLIVQKTRNAQNWILTKSGNAYYLHNKKTTHNIRLSGAKDYESIAAKCKNAEDQEKEIEKSAVVSQTSQKPKEKQKAARDTTNKVSPALNNRGNAETSDKADPVLISFVTEIENTYPILKKCKIRIAPEQVEEISETDHDLSKNRENRFRLTVNGKDIYTDDKENVQLRKAVSEIIADMIDTHILYAVYRSSVSVAAVDNSIFADGLDAGIDIRNLLLTHEDGGSLRVYVSPFVDNEGYPDIELYAGNSVVPKHGKILPASILFCASRDEINEMAAQAFRRYLETEGIVNLALGTSPVLTASDTGIIAKVQADSYFDHAKTIKNMKTKTGQAVSIMLTTNRKEPLTQNEPTGIYLIPKTSDRILAINKTNDGICALCYSTENKKLKSPVSFQSANEKACIVETVAEYDRFIKICKDKIAERQGYNAKAHVNIRISANGEKCADGLVVSISCPQLKISEKNTFRHSISSSKEKTWNRYATDIANLYETYIWKGKLFDLDFFPAETMKISDLQKEIILRVQKHVSETPIYVIINEVQMKTKYSKEEIRKAIFDLANKGLLTGKSTFFPIVLQMKKQGKASVWTCRISDLFRPVDIVKVTINNLPMEELQAAAPEIRTSVLKRISAALDLADEEKIVAFFSDMLEYCPVKTASKFLRSADAQKIYQNISDPTYKELIACIIERFDGCDQIAKDIRAGAYSPEHQDTAGLRM